MNQNEAKRLVCAKTAQMLWEAVNDDFLLLNLHDDYPGPGNFSRFERAADELVDELLRRAGMPPRGQVQVVHEGQLDIFGFLEVEDVQTDLL